MIFLLGSSTIFQSTLPVWGATLHLIMSPSMVIVFQSTLPVWGATRNTGSIMTAWTFQSTLPVWGATLSALEDKIKAMISIHAPRVGSDNCAVGRAFQPQDFNPRSPCGERPKQNVFFANCKRFQSTLPVWGATIVNVQDRISKAISIHAPRVGSDSYGQSVQREH